MTEFNQVQAFAYDLKQTHADRDKLLDYMRDMYLLEWDEQKKLEETFAHMRPTLSPDARNKIRTAVRLMTATEPVVNVPKDLQREMGEDMGDRIEKIAKIILRQSDRIRGKPVAYDACLSGLLYDEIHISINDTSQLLEYSQGVGKALANRYKRINGLTPYLLDVHDPHGCYSDFDSMGLTAWARSVDMSRAQILSRYGADGEKAIGDMGKKYAAMQTLPVWTCYTLKEYACWVEGSTTPIHWVPEHNLPFIPIVVHTVEGSRALFKDIDEQREPFLMTLWKSGLWKRSNLYLSAMATSAASSLWPQLRFRSPDRAAPDIDMSVPWGVMHLYPNEELDTWNRNLIDPGLQQMYAVTQQLSTDSTLYDQVAGAPLGPGATYSETALLNQAGRLPLVGIQRTGGWALGDALRQAFLMMRDSGGKYGARGASYQEINSADIPESLEIEVMLDVALPQDRMQMAQIVSQLRGVMPTEWLLENVFQIRQPAQLVDDAMSEQAYQVLWQAYVQQQAAKVMQPPQPPQLGQPGMPGQAPPQIPPEMMGGLPPEMGGLPGGIPPEMLMGGQAGPLGATGTPEEGQYGFEQV